MEDIKTSENKKQKSMDLTVGHPLKQILLFALPLVFGTMFQQLYSFADTVIVGRCLGIDALAAVGATYSLHFLILGFVQGACVGFGIPLAQSFGAGEKRELHRFLWNGFWVGSFFSVLLTVGTVILAAPLMAAMNTPENIFSMGVSYIRILFLGIPASILYNYSASVLRALGDSRHPFYFLLFSSILNVVLDYVFITDFHTGVEGAAAATVISQLVSGLLNTWWMFRRMELIEIRREDMSLSFRHIRKLCIIGLPMGVEYSVSAVGAILLQDAINILGSGAVAAQTAGEKIRQMFTLPMESIGMAMATYAGQNFGAGRMDRIKRGIRDGIVIQALYCAVVWVILLLMKGILVQLVLGSGSIQVARNAEKYLMICSCLFLLHGLLMIFRNVLQGMGYAGHAVLSGIWELAGRGLGGWIAVSGAGFTAVCFANPMAWGFALCYCAVMVLWF
ncbi:MAG: MATE family efflux transporter [Blautia hansenii]